MKKYAILLITVLSLVSISCKEKIEKEKAVHEKLTNRIEVIDFHSTHRCMTCNAIEANTKYTLENYFSEELAKNSISFQVINVDLDENIQICEKFEATGTALFLNVIVDGKETALDLTEFAFMNGNDQEIFSKELKTKLELALADL